MSVWLDVGLLELDRGEIGETGGWEELYMYMALGYTLGHVSRF